MSLWRASILSLDKRDYYRDWDQIFSTREEAETSLLRGQHFHVRVNEIAVSAIYVLERTEEMPESSLH